MLATARQTLLATAVLHAGFPYNKLGLQLHCESECQSPHKSFPTVFEKFHSPCGQRCQMAPQSYETFLSNRIVLN